MQALRAEFVVPLEANRTSNFAIPITQEWIEHGGSVDEDVQIYCQVDIHVCADEDEWDRIVFFHAFGDLGMILGLISRNCGFSLGTKGLKVIQFMPQKLVCMTSDLIIDTFEFRKSPLSLIFLFRLYPRVL